MVEQFQHDPQYPSIEPYLLQLSVLLSSRFDRPEATRQRMEQLIQKYPDIASSYGVELNRSKGHLAVSQGRIKEGLELLLSSEMAERNRNETHLANYIGFEILEILLDNPELSYQDVITRLEANTDYDYLFFKLKAQFLAREKRFMDAAMLMQENKLKANQLWKTEDQLLLEQYQQESN